MKNAHGRTCKTTKVSIYLYISLYENLFGKNELKLMWLKVIKIFAATCALKLPLYDPGWIDCWTVKQALRSSSNVLCGVGLARALLPRIRCAWRPAKFYFLPNRKYYFLSVISGYNAKYINSFHNSINKQFHMFIGLHAYKSNLSVV